MCNRFVGHLSKDRPASVEESLRDFERGEGGLQVDRLPLHLPLRDLDLGGPVRRRWRWWRRWHRRLNDPGRLAVALQQPDHHVAVIPSGMPQLETFRDQSPLFGAVDCPAVLGSNTLGWIGDEYLAAGRIYLIDEFSWVHGHCSRNGVCRPGRVDSSQPPWH